VFESKNVNTFAAREYGFIDTLLLCAARNTTGTGTCSATATASVSVSAVVLVPCSTMTVIASATIPQNCATPLLLASNATSQNPNLIRNGNTISINNWTLDGSDFGTEIAANSVTGWIQTPFSEPNGYCVNNVEIIIILFIRNIQY
jgi:hypothetical protein